MKSLRLWFLLVLALAIPLGFAQKTVVKPNDNVNVVCEEEPSLSKDYVITRDGFIIMQFIGAVNIAGLREDAAAAKIAATLIEQRIVARATVKLKILGAAKGGLISYAGAVSKTGDIFPREGIRLSDVVNEAKPTSAADLAHVRIVPADGKTVIVDYTAYDGKDNANNPGLRSGDKVFFDLIARTPDISVTGQVGRPGMVPFTRGLTLKGAIQASGGLSPSADLTGVRVERDGTAMPAVDLKSSDLELKAGDHVFVPASSAPVLYVTVTGMVKSPQRVVYRDGLTLDQALISVGGAQNGADMEHVRIKRTVSGKEKVLTHNAKSAEGGMAGPFALKANDIVEVNAPAKRKSSSRNGNLLKIAGIAILGLLLGILH
jgi:protein involved in polysaccharide export with SLBB domain